MSAITALTEWKDSLPDSHPEKIGAIRAIEVLQVYGPRESVDLTDREVAALFDSLIFMRDHLMALRVNAPNVKSALVKIKSLMTPNTYGLRIEALP